jgi:hypothetical protein
MTLCLQCGKPIQNTVYAVYFSNKKGETDEIAGFLCDQCAKKNKYKPVKKQNSWEKLEQLKALLKEE